MSQREATLKILFSEPCLGVLLSIMEELREKAVNDIVREQANAPARLRAIVELQGSFQAYANTYGTRSQ